MVNDTEETYYFATNEGDRKFILWLRDRLVNVYGEDPNTDFVLTLTKFAEEINQLVHKGMH